MILSYLLHDGLGIFHDGLGITRDAKSITRDASYRHSLHHATLPTHWISTPVVDTAGRRTIHGGIFQVLTVTSAMGKTCRSLQIVGRILFVQCTELINPSLNNGLPSELDADEPSQSFFMKGVDISIAALQAELGFLANPVASHVQTAEMGNQSVSSLALLSARYTHTALDALSQLAAAYCCDL